MLQSQPLLLSSAASWDLPADLLAAATLLRGWWSQATSPGADACWPCLPLSRPCHFHPALFGLRPQDLCLFSKPQEPSAGSCEGGVCLCTSTAGLGWPGLCDREREAQLPEPAFSPSSSCEETARARFSFCRTLCVGGQRSVGSGFHDTLLFPPLSPTSWPPWPSGYLTLSALCPVAEDPSPQGNKRPECLGLPRPACLPAWEAALKSHLLEASIPEQSLHPPPAWSSTSLWLLGPCRTCDQQKETS